MMMLLFNHIKGLICALMFSCWYDVLAELFLSQLVGGVDMTQQAISLGKRPHIVVCCCRYHFCCMSAFVLIFRGLVGHNDLY